MSLKNLKVGDRISINIYLLGKWEFRTISKINKTSVEDSAGQRWTLGGSLWGSSDSWRGPYAVPYELQHDADNSEIEKELQERAWRKSLQVFAADPQSNIEVIKTMLSCIPAQ